MYFIVFICVTCENPNSLWQWTIMDFDKKMMAFSFVSLSTVLAFLLIPSIAVFSSVTSFILFCFCYLLIETEGMGRKEPAFFGERKCLVCLFQVLIGRKGQDMVKNLQPVCSEVNLFSSVWTSNRFRALSCYVEKGTTGQLMKTRFLQNNEVVCNVLKHVTLEYTDISVLIANCRTLFWENAYYCFLCVVCKKRNRLW